ncbi:MULTISPECIES: CRISPR-associated helicase Cas3' [Paenibacillus]|uniref:CRISPR-associated helicase Cas3' n=1 Tax=Paenibacillus TaxID=44249 RepID=UPI00242F0566|nr:CRISPR-associated helicase Cas3' [Paenibacillus macerans]
MIFFAKSTPPLPETETIQQHTNALIACYHQLKNGYGNVLRMSDRDWQLLYWAVLYHDVGKYDAVFQNKIRRALKQRPVDTQCNFDVRHNYVSVMALPFKKLGLSDDEKYILAQAVGYHHERNDNIINQEVAAIYKQHILPHRDQIERELGIELDDKCISQKLAHLSNTKRIREDKGDVFLRYVLIKGLLHRLDHAASAHVPVELAIDMHVGEYVDRFIQTNFGGKKNELQQFTERHRDQHVVVVAQTGMGKTEAGLLWLGSSKGFFTLPLRVSINAMYGRITDKNKIGFSRSSLSNGEGEEATGLLHSTSLDYLHEKSNEKKEAELDEKMETNRDDILEKIHSQSREYANKLVISTIDQILKFPFFYLGFEKEYATVASAKVIIDELQAYNPRIAALIVRALVLIDRIGGSFMIMTATLPDFYYKALIKHLGISRLPVACEEFIDDSVVRHHVQLSPKSILDESVIEQIAEEGKNSKVLVICNTVRRAREVYEALKLRTEQAQLLLQLLHSKYIKKDRDQKESDILEFAKGEGNGIWVATQLVEASLDIDFDRLHTEMSTLDSQFQRYGRCNRKGKKSIDEVNIHVYTGDVSGVKLGKNSVYHDDIYNRSLELFAQHESGILLESDKQRMIRALYDEGALKDSKFKEEFDKTMKELEDRPMYELDKLEAQQLLRDIREVQAIPDSYRETKEIEEALEVWKKAKDKRAKRKARRTIENYTVGVNYYMAEDKKILTPFPIIKGLYYVNAKYCEETGLDIQGITAPLFQ